MGIATWVIITVNILFFIGAMSRMVPAMPSSVKFLKLRTEELL